MRPFTRFLALLPLALAACGPRALDTADAVSRFRPWPSLVEADQAYGDHPRQRLDVHRPRGDGTGRPVVVFFYGGGWSSGDRRSYRFAGRAFAEKGFVAIVPDYRLVPEVRFPAFVQDGAAAVRWARDNAARYGGDPNRITVAGHSAGAYIGAMLTLDPRWLAAAGAPGAIRAGALLAGPYDFLPFTDRRAVEAFGNWPKPEETQPFTFARADAPPLLLATGTLDRTVQPRNSEVLTARLRRLGAPAEFKSYPGQDHAGVVMALAKPLRGRAPVLDDMAAFLEAKSR